MLLGYPASKDLATSKDNLGCFQCFSIVLDFSFWIFIACVPASVRLPPLVAHYSTVPCFHVLVRRFTSTISFRNYCTHNARARKKKVDCRAYRDHRPARVLLNFENFKYRYNVLTVWVPSTCWVLKFLWS